MGILTSPQSPIHIAGWRVSIKPMSVSSAWLKLSCPTRFSLVIGTIWNDPNGTPTYGIIPPYSEPFPSVPINGSTYFKESAQADAHTAAAKAATQNLFARCPIVPLLKYRTNYSTAIATIHSPDIKSRMYGSSGQRAMQGFPDLAKRIDRTNREIVSRSTSQSLCLTPSRSLQCQTSLPH